MKQLYTFHRGLNSHEEHHANKKQARQRAQELANQHGTAVAVHWQGWQHTAQPINTRASADQVKAAMKSPFIAGFITCALWASTDDSGEPLDRNHTAEDFTAEALHQIITECQAFNDFAAPLPLYGGTPQTAVLAAERAGHDYFLTRNGHGAGFWDRDELSETDQQRLTNLSKAAGELDIMTDDEGRLTVFPIRTAEQIRANHAKANPLERLQICITQDANSAAVFFTATNPENGKTTQAKAGTLGNIRLAELKQRGAWPSGPQSRWYVTEDTLKTRAFDREAKALPYAGNNPEDILLFIRREIG